MSSVPGNVNRSEEQRKRPTLQNIATKEKPKEIHTRKSDVLEIAVTAMSKANRLYQDAKLQLEQSGNLKTSIKETVVNNLSELFGIVLQLNEERQTLLLQLEKARIQLKDDLLRQEKQYVESLRALMDQGSIRDIQSALTETVSDMRTLTDSLKHTMGNDTLLDKHTFMGKSEDTRRELMEIKEELSSLKDQMGGLRESLVISETNEPTYASIAGRPKAKINSKMMAPMHSVLFADLITYPFTYGLFDATRTHNSKTLGIRTPTKSTRTEKSPPKTGSETSKVRRSIDDWEANIDSTPSMTSTTMQAGTAKTKQTVSASQNSKITHKVSVQVHTPPKQQYENRTMEAKACLTKGKLHLNASRNTKTEIKNSIIEALDRLYQLVKEAEIELKAKKSKGEKEKSEKVELETAIIDSTFSVVDSDLKTRIEEHAILLLETNNKMEELKESMEKQRGTLERVTNNSKCSSKNKVQSSTESQNSTSGSCADTLDLVSQCILAAKLTHRLDYECGVTERNKAIAPPRPTVDYRLGADHETERATDGRDYIVLPPHPTAATDFNIQRRTNTAYGDFDLAISCDINRVPHVDTSARRSRILLEINRIYDIISSSSHCVSTPRNYVSKLLQCTPTNNQLQSRYKSSLSKKIDKKKKLNKMFSEKNELKEAARGRIILEEQRETESGSLKLPVPAGTHAVRVQVTLHSDPVSWPKKPVQTIAPDQPEKPEQPTVPDQPKKPEQPTVPDQPEKHDPPKRWLKPPKPQKPKIYWDNRKD
ncbi:unnamed protein product [Parnassius apollo]|uniref:(apollo) hypothetical protein n=2 Tax=Parnassius apollo TaxID=110799 RepID=A0A8S3Y1M3_PARAO|nr:unnamed protein product [Parnassius apollo]